MSLKINLCDVLKKGVLLAACASVLAPFAMPSAALAVRKTATAGDKGVDPDSDEGKMEYKANDMISKGIELIRQKQEDRGLKLLQSVPDTFPKAKARFTAHLELGKYYMDKHSYDLAVKQFAYLSDSEDVDQSAEGMYQTGICYYNMNNYDKAFMALRKVTNDFPWSVFANESYYYIGQCHFKLGRWSKAIEAMEMVGTSVPGNVEGDQFAEAGQRLYVKIFDKDLVVLLTSNDKVGVKLTTLNGDEETVTLDPLGRSGEYLIGSIPTVPGKAVKGDNTLQIIGRDAVTVDYLDSNTEGGKLNQEIIAKIQMVSTASIGFTDGAYREYTAGVFGGQDAFLRVKDLDRDTTDAADVIQVKVRTEHKVEKEESPEKTGVDLNEEEEKRETRDTITVNLTETGEHTGIFTGKVVATVVEDAKDVNVGDQILSAVKGDDVVMTYTDEFHVISAEPREVSASAKLLIGQIKDVENIQRVVPSAELRARKNLIEAKIFLRLGGIFKEVGLTNKASEKAEEGLSRVDDVISASLKNSFDRSLVEDAFSVKWDLLLIQDKLGEAIAVCRTLTQMFPDSSLVDRALLKIGEAKMESERPGEAIEVFSSVINLPKSELKAEAQYQIGATMEKIAVHDGEINGREPNLSNAILAYKRCAETYPESPFAGDSLDKIANYYINAKDYARAIELMERVFADYPDASFLDKMLLKWVIASYRMGNLAQAKEKAETLLSEYPSSKLADKAKQFLDTINKKTAG